MSGNTAQPGRGPRTRLSAGGTTPLSPLELILADTMAMMTALETMDLDEARFRCELIIVGSGTSGLHSVHAKAIHAAHVLGRLTPSQNERYLREVADLVNEVGAAVVVD